VQLSGIHSMVERFSETASSQRSKRVRRGTARQSAENPSSNEGQAGIGTKTVLPLYLYASLASVLRRHAFGFVDRLFVVTFISLSNPRIADVL
jgi:hypothetical protein